MAATVGENMQREWDAEPRAAELWDSFQALKQNRASGIEMLTRLAEQGSALAMMCLGHALVEGSDQNEQSLGEAWLTRSAEAGSIEGGYQLAVHHQMQRNGGRAIAELKALAGKGYAPAMYRLGSIFYRGELVEKDVSQALHYLTMAKAAGHLPAMGYLSWIYRKENFGLAGRIASHWNCLAKIPAVAWYVIRNPNSDRLRGFNVRSSHQQSA